MWLLILMLYTMNPVADIAMASQIGPFETARACNDALESAKLILGGERGLKIKGACVLQK